jgi:hypothetical protein
MLLVSAKLYRITLGDSIYSLQREFLHQPRRSTDFTPLFSQAGEFPAGNIVDIATKISEGHYAFLGLKLDSGTRINWHKDYYSGFVWPLLTHNKVRGVTPENVDLKHPWELSSFFHLFPVAVAYNQTGHKKYRIFVIDQIKDWLAGNPCPLGVNWANPMVAALRLILLIEVVNLICPGNNEPTFRKEVDTAIWRHFLFLVNNLENLGPCPGNHYLTNIVGIAWACLYFSPKHMMIAFYRNWAIDKLSNEIERQTHADAMNFEGSTCYHRLVTELLLYTVILMQKNGIEVPTSLRNRLGEMLEVLSLFADLRGDIPVVGDNDSCRLFYGSDYFDWNSKNINYLLPAGLRLYNKNISSCNNNVTDHGIRRQGSAHLPSSKRLQGTGDARHRPAMCTGVHEQADNTADSVPCDRLHNNDELSRWIWGEHYPDEQCQAPLSDRRTTGRAASLDSSGFYISKHNSDYLLINCNHPGQITCGHSHNDTLSFVLHFDGTEIFIDPGSYVYTRDPAIRNYFRSTGCHNVLRVNGEEQWPIPDKKPFSLPKKTPPRVLTWQSDGKEDIFEGEHYGYLRLPEQVIHRRYFRYRKRQGELRVRDHVYSCSAERDGTATTIFKISSFFHVSRDVTIKRQKGNILALQRKKGGAPLCYLAWSGNDNPRVEIKDAWVSEAYGVKHKAEMIVFEVDTPLPYSFDYMISKAGEER